jgi:hypothetical protein
LAQFTSAGLQIEQNAQPADADPSGATWVTPEPAAKAKRGKKATEFAGRAPASGTTGGTAAASSSSVPPAAQAEPVEDGDPSADGLDLVKLLAEARKSVGKTDS